MHASPVTTGGVPATTGCANNYTCGPSFCQRVSNAACCPANGLPALSTGGTCPTVTDPPVAQQIAGLTCRTCNQSSDARCSSAALSSTFVGPGVKAAYCNDDFLVVHSDGTPNHPTYLQYIQRPPGSAASGAGYGDQCVTRSMKTQVRSRWPPWGAVRCRRRTLA